MQGQQNMSLKLVMNITLKLQVKESLDSLAWKFAKLNQLCTIDMNKNTKKIALDQEIFNLLMVTYFFQYFQLKAQNWD